MEVKDDSNTSIVCIALAVSDLHTMIDRVLLTPVFPNWMCVCMSTCARMCLLYYVEIVATLQHDGRSRRARVPLQALRWPSRPRL